MGPPRHRGLEMRRGLVRIVAVAALTTGLAATTVGASTPANAQLRRAKMLAWVNHSRVEHHVPQLRMVRSVVGLAHAHNVASSAGAQSSTGQGTGTAHQAIRNN